MRYVAVLLAGFTLFGCYRVVRHHRKETTVTTVQTRETQVPTYGSRLELAPRDLMVVVSRDLECRQIADVDVEYESITDYREYNWPKIPFFTGLGVGAVVSGSGLLVAAGPASSESGWVAVATGAGIASVGLIFGVVHLFAPEDKQESELQPPRREERIVKQTPACSTGPVADEAVQLVTNQGRTLELRTDAEGRIAIPLDRLAHTTLLDGELGTLEFSFEGKTIRHRLDIPPEMLPSIARAASKTPNPIPDRALSVADTELVDRAQKSIGRSDCTSAVLALDRASKESRESSRFLETYGNALSCAGREEKAQRVYGALYRMKPTQELEYKLFGGNEPALEPQVMAELAAAQNPLHQAVLAVFPIHFNLRKKVPQNDRSGLFQLYLASLGEQGVRMVPPSELKRLLSKQKVNSFRECYDTNCQIELGKAMAASVALQTAVTPIGDTCIVTSTAFDLKTETSIRTAKRKTPCQTKALGDALEALALDLGSH